MARVTVEDCILKIPNRFQLVMMAAQRSRELSVGQDPTLDRDNDKNPVVALREIAEDTIALPVLENAIIEGLQRNLKSDDPEGNDELDGQAHELARMIDAPEKVEPRVSAPMPESGWGEVGSARFDDAAPAEIAAED